jgi:hypothetical protein
MLRMRPGIGEGKVRSLGHWKIPGFYSGWNKETEDLGEGGYDLINKFRTFQVEHRL